MEEDVAVAEASSFVMLNAVVSSKRRAIDCAPNYTPEIMFT